MIMSNGLKYSSLLYRSTISYANKNSFTIRNNILQIYFIYLQTKTKGNRFFIIYLHVILIFFKFFNCVVITVAGTFQPLPCEYIFGMSKIKCLKCLETSDTWNTSYTHSEIVELPQSVFLFTQWLNSCN